MRFSPTPWWPFLKHTPRGLGRGCQVLPAVSPGRWGRAVNSGRRASAAHTHPPFGQQDASPDDAPWPRSWARQGEEEKGRTSLKLELTTVPAPGARGAQTAPALFAAARLAPPGLHICGMSCS